MKNLIHGWILFVLLPFAISEATAAERDLLVIGEEFPPFEFIQNEKVVGIDIDIANHIFEKMGIRATFKLFPWKRAWAMVEKGEADAVLTTSRKKSREPFVWYPKEDMWISRFVFFTRKNALIHGFKGYQTAVAMNLKVGIILGNSYHPSFWEAFPYQDGSTSFQGEFSDGLNNQLEPGVSLSINLRKLAAGRIDLFPSDKTFGIYTIRLEGLQDVLTFYDIPLYSKPYPMAFVKKSAYPDLRSVMSEFDRELKSLKQSGEYQIFFDTWLK